MRSRLTDEDNDTGNSAYGDFRSETSMIERLSNGETCTDIWESHGVSVDRRKLPASEGMPTRCCMCRQVDADSPAMEAGIQSGDVLTEDR